MTAHAAFCKPAVIERRERRVQKIRDWDAEWAEHNDYNKWEALVTRKEKRRARGKANVVPCKFRIRFGVKKN